MLARIKMYIDHQKLTIAAFERSIGMSNASFGKSLKKGKGIGTDKLEKILLVYPDINAEWLLTGKGEMFKTPTKRKKKGKERKDFLDDKVFNLELNNEKYEIALEHLNKKIKDMEEIMKTKDSIIGILEKNIKDKEMLIELILKDNKSK